MQFLQRFSPLIAACRVPVRWERGEEGKKRSNSAKKANSCSSKMARAMFCRAIDTFTTGNLRIQVEQRRALALNFIALPIGKRFFFLL